MKKESVCRICQSKNTKPFFDLGKQPLANSLLSNSRQKEEFFPLSLSWCAECNLIQLNHTVAPKKLFSNYVWVTGTSATAREFAEKFCQALIERCPPGLKKGYVLEVASNDGVFLKPFIKKGYKVLGVDPAANIVKMAVKDGVPTVCDFFSVKSAGKILAEYGPAHTVFARNVLPHVANTRDFVSGLKKILHQDGTLAIEVHYAKKILRELHYDSIYHEHLCYFTVKSLERLLNDFGLFIFDIKESPISGGSIVVYAKKQRIKEEPAVRRYREQEGKDCVNDFSSWKEFAKKSFEHRGKLLKLLNSYGDKNEIVGYGASARSSTMLNFCGIDSKMISVIADRSPLKHNLYTAGTHILIQSPETVMGRRPKVILILAWNFAKEIIEYLKKEFQFRGRYIIPLPETPRIKKTIIYGAIER